MDWEGATKHARNVLGDPENVNAYVNLCVTYFKQGTWTKPAAGDHCA